MDRRFGACVLLVCCLAIVIRFMKPDSLLGQLSSVPSLLVEESLDFDPLITERPSLAAIRPYDFYKISMQWPKTFCGSRPGCFTPAYFTIHGLWPQYRPDTPVPPYNATDPNRCTNVSPTPASSITSASLAPILNNMNHYWPNLTNPTITDNLMFWHYEWNRHGKCWNTPQQPNDYFQQALNFASQHNLVNILQIQGIVPNSTTTYNRNNIANAVRNGLGSIPEINCKNGNQLKEIRVCYDRNNSLFNCPKNFTGCNSQQLVFPKP